MTTTPADLDALKADIKQAHDEICNIAEGKRRWTMSIPAKEATDSDLVISRALAGAERALDELATERRQNAAMASITGEAIRQIGEERDAAREELAKTRAELVTMTAVAKSNKAVTQNMAQELVKALDILLDLTDTDPCSFDHHGYCQAHGWLTDGECPHARAKRLLAENGEAIPATTAEPAVREVTLAEAAQHAIDVTLDAEQRRIAQAEREAERYRDEDTTAEPDDKPKATIRTALGNDWSHLLNDDAEPAAS